jgi:hypothetical protein
MLSVASQVSSRYRRPHPGIGGRKWIRPGGKGTRARTFGVALLLLTLLGPIPVAAQTTATVSGRILDPETDDPVPDAEVRLLGTGLMAVSNERGSFRFQEVAPGSYRIEIRHIAYGVHTETIEVEEGTALSLQIGITREAIELEPLTVQVYTARDVRLRASGVQVSEVSREQLDLADVRGANLGQVLEQNIPGIMVRESTALVGLPMCVEFRGARFGQFDGSCRSPAVYLDGVPVNNPTFLYGSLDMGDIERLEMVPPAEAGVRFGTGALYGALVIETRVPGVRDKEEAFRIGPLSVEAFDWSQEPKPHNTWKVFAYSLIGNAAGLAVGVPLANQCIEVVSPTFDRVSSKCSGFPTMGSAVAGVLFPAVGASLGARFGGQTSLSRGDFVPTAIAAVMALIPGYALEVSSRRSGWQNTSVVAKVILTVGVPAAVTFADRLFRKLRPSPSLDPGDPGFH